MEPWDGPAGIIYTDGIGVGAALDRNGLRPLRYAVCEDGLVVCCSEAGAVDISGHGLVERGRLGPGQVLFVDPSRGVLRDDECKERLAAAAPYARWAADGLRKLDPGRPIEDPDSADILETRQAGFGYTKEELAMVLRPMAHDAKDPTFAMGDDAPLPNLAGRPRPMHHYLRQRFAQVTNPPIDHLRERLVMSLRTTLGPPAPLLRDGPDAGRLLQLDSFLLFPSGVSGVRSLPAPFQAVDLDASFAVVDGAAGLEGACRRLARDAESAIEAGAAILIISDTAANHDRAPVPALLAVGSVHHHLMRAGLRSRTSLIVETDEARDVHHVVALLGYGAQAICPRLALQSIASLSPPATQERYVKAIEDGTLKVLAKMGISTIDSYQGAQIFEIIGLHAAVVDTCFAGTPSPIGGATFSDLGEEVLTRHAAGFRQTAPSLTSPGFFKHHKTGTEFHATNPDVVDALQASASVKELAAAHALRRAVGDRPRDEAAASYERFTRLIADRPPTY